MKNVHADPDRACQVRNLAVWYLAAAVRECMDDPARRRLFGLQGREDVAAGFSWPAIVDRLAGLYHEVVARAGGRGRGASAA